MGRVRPAICDPRSYHQMATSEVLSSPANPLLRDVRRARAQGGLTADGCCVAETFHLLEEALRSGCEVKAVLASESARDAVERRLRSAPAPRLAVLPDALFRRISATESSQGVMALVRPPQWTLGRLFAGQALVVVLDGIQDPGNAGTIVRAAEAFDATGVIFLKGTVSPFNPKSVRASAGSLFRMPLLHGVEPAFARAAFDERELHVYTAGPRARLPLAGAALDRKCALVIGSEARGVSRQDWSTATGVRIPTRHVESLNAAVAAGILLYEAGRQRAEAL